MHINQQQQIQQPHSNLVKSPQVILTRSDSTSTVFLDETIRGEQIHLPGSLLVNRSISLRSLLKTSGLFNTDMESSDKLNELFTDGNEFTLHRLLSDYGSNDMNIDMTELAKFDPTKLLDTRCISEFFEQTNTPIDIQSNHLDSVPPSAIACSSASFSELYPPTPEPLTKDVFLIDANQLKMEPENPLIYTELSSFDNFPFTPSTSTPTAQQFIFDEHALAGYQHDYGFLSKRSTVVDTPSPSPAISKRTSARVPRRTSSRLQSRAALNDDDDSCLSPTISENSSISIKRSKRSRHVNRATDIKTEDDLSYYLERRRKNNEASKMSRAARKQKFGHMDLQCAEYARVNAELRLKITTLETVTANLKSGLIQSFQHKGVANSKF